MKGQQKNLSLLVKIAIVLKELRNEAGLTQLEVYYDTSIHIGRIETFKLNLSITTLETLCIYYGISLPDFFLKVDSLG